MQTPTVTTLADLDDHPHATVFEGEPRTIRLELDADESVPAHSHPGRTVVLHVVAGHLAVDLDGTTHDLRAGQVLRCDGDREIAPTAHEPTTALVVLAPTD